MKGECLLSAKPTGISSTFEKPHYLVVDTNVVLDQIDVLEEEAIKDVIVLYTVLDEVKHKSSAVFKRFRDILMNPTRRFYTFVNEHHKDTYVKRDPGESANDRNDRAIRVATQWFEKHLKQNEEEIQVILLTDDVNNRTMAHEMGLLACSMGDYVRSCTHQPQLVDKLSQKHHEFGGNKVDLFPAHLTPAQIHDGIKNGKIFQGSFVSSRDNFLEGFVNVEGYEKFVSVQLGKTLRMRFENCNFNLSMYSFRF